MNDLPRMRETDRWIAWVRLAAVPFAIVNVAFVTHYPAGYAAVGGAITAVFSVPPFQFMQLDDKEVHERLVGFGLVVPDSRQNTVAALKQHIDDFQATYDKLITELGIEAQ